MTTPTLDIAANRPSWERTRNAEGIVRPNSVQSPSRRWRKRDGAKQGETLVLVWDTMTATEYLQVKTVLKSVGNNKVVAFTPPDEGAARGFRVQSVNLETPPGQNYRIEVTLKSLPGTKVT